MSCMTNGKISRKKYIGADLCVCTINDKKE